MKRVQLTIKQPFTYFPKWTCFSFSEPYLDTDILGTTSILILIV